MKQWKERARRLQAGILAFAMCLSLSITGVWAVEPTTKKGEVVPGAFVADQTNKTLPKDFTDGASNTVSTPGPGGEVSVTKFAVAVPCQDGNQFEVTLQVVTHDQEIKKVESPDAAVTLVIDLSSSMQGSMDVNGIPKTRLQAAQEAARAFVADFVKDANGAKRMVSLVGFWGGGEIRTIGNGYWIDAAAKNADGELANLALVNAAIDALPTTMSGTNIQAGLELANNLYNQKNTWAQPVAGIENRFSVLLTDGSPYDRITGTVNGTETNYTNTTKDDGDNTKYPTEAAQKLLAAGIQSYAICFASGDKVQEWMKVADETTTTQDQTLTIKWEEEDDKWEEDGEAQWDEERWVSGGKKTTTITYKGVTYSNVPCYFNKDQDKMYTKFTIPGTTTTAPKAFDMAVVAKDAATLNQQFQAITALIKLSVDAWTVTDPMADDVKFEGFVGSQGSAVEKDNNITWDLKQEKTNVKTDTKDNKTTFTYTLKYLVTVDATGENYDETVIHPLNKYTELKYMFMENDQRVDENGGPYTGDPAKLDTIGFNVPGVIVERPIVSYTVNYWYKDRETGEYVNGKTRSEEAKIWSKTYDIKSTDYSKENYQFVKGPTGEQTLSEDGMVFDLYYDPIMTTATVNYHYKLTIIDEEGKETVQNFDPTGIPVKNLYVGDRYEFSPAEKSTFGGNTYDFVKAEPGTVINSLKETAADNVIDLYYTLTIDQRAAASVVVDHVYTLHTYELEDGKYVAKDVVEEVPNVVSESGHKAGETYTASYYPTTGYGTYGFAGIVGKDNVKVLESGPNVITLYFEDWEDPRGEQLSLTVKHHYTKSETKVVDGKVVTTVDPDNEVGRTDTIKFYAGETVTVAKQRVYNDETYEIGGASDTVTLPNPMDGAEYSLFYTLVKVPEKTTVTVTHIYRSITKETVTKYEPYRIDEDTVIQIPVGTEVVDGDPVTDKTVVEEPVEVYVGEKYTATLRGETGYEYFSSTPNGYTVEACVKDGNKIEIIYQKSVNTDNRDEATIDVQHRYTTHVTAIVGGEEKTFDIVNSEFDQATTGKAGDKFQAETKPEDKDGNVYTLVGNEPAEVVLHAGTNSTIVIDYERSLDQRGAKVEYTVSYEYYTRTMTVVNGVAVWGEPVLDTETTENPAGDGYVGQKVTLDTGAKDGYTAYGNNPSATQFLAKSNNQWTFQYVKDVPLEKVPVTVNHHITTKTLTVDGEFELAQHLMGRPEYKYKGEAYEAKALELGENATLTLVNVNGSDVATAETITGEASTGAVVIDFYYEIVIDYRRPVEYSIQYYYYDVDYDGTETLTGEPPVTTGSSYAGAALTTNPEKEDIKGYKLTESTFNGNDIMDLPSVTLVDGENKVVYVYKRSVDTRAATSVKVIHEYYASANSETPAYTDEENFTENLRAGMLFEATPVTTKNDVTYTRTTEDSALTITLVANAADNVITIKYVRAATTYTVVHEYYTDGTLTGSTSATVVGEVGATITADGITKVTTYGGNTYTYTSAAGAPLTLVQGENGAITLRYDRTTGGGGGGTTEDTYRLTIHYVYADGTTARNDYVRSGLRAGASYSRTSPVISGYTADITLVEGTMPARNVEVTVTYTTETSEPTETPEPSESPEPTPAPTETPEIEDLGDEDVPLSELPEDVVDLWDEDVALSDLPEELEELSDEDVPLAEVPATGDSLLTWLSGALASGAGLMWLGGRKKKEDEAEEI